MTGAAVVANTELAAPPTTHSFITSGFLLVFLCPARGEIKASSMLTADCTAIIASEE